VPAVVADDLPPPPTVTAPPTPLEATLIGGWDLDRSSGRFANDPAPRRGVAFSQAQHSVSRELSRLGNDRGIWDLVQRRRLQRGTAGRRSSWAPIP